MHMSLKGNKEYVVSAQWLKPYLQILTARQLSQLIKLSLSALRRFLITKGDLAAEVFNERVLNELILVLINCKFDEVDFHETYSISVLILRALEAIFLHKTATKLRQDTVLALFDYLEDESQLEGLHELSKSIIAGIVKSLFSDPSMHVSSSQQNKVLVEVFKHICNTAEHLCLSREALKSSTDYKLKLQSVDSLSTNLGLAYRILKFSGPYLTEENLLVGSITSKLCPILHQV